MKIFLTSGYPRKVNFVDSNNVLLGYSLEQNCCESADWFIADKITFNTSVEKDNSLKLENFYFDTSFFQEVHEIIEPCDWSPSEKRNSLDEGGMVIFRITDGTEEKFIHLFNIHNGYYSHGFEMNVGGTDIYGGSI